MELGVYCPKNSKPVVITTGFFFNLNIKIMNTKITVTTNYWRWQSCIKHGYNGLLQTLFW